MNQKRARWRKLDNAAKLFLAASTKRDTRVFRFYCELKEEVKKEILQKALDQTVETYPVFLSVIRKGLFWSYLEMSSLHPEVRRSIKNRAAVFISGIKRADPKTIAALVNETAV